MLTSISLRDFKNHQDTRLELGNLVCLVGPNGSGKTSLLEAIHFACTSLNHGAATFFQSPYVFEDFVRKGSEGFDVQLKAKMGGQTVKYGLHGIPSPPKQLFGNITDTPSFSVTSDIRSDTLPISPAIDNDLTTAGLSRFESWLPVEFQEPPAHSFMFSPFIQRLRAPSYVATETPTMHADGSSIAPVIAYLMTAEPDRFEALSDRVRSVLPGVRRLRARPAKVDIQEMHRQDWKPIRYGW